MKLTLSLVASALAFSSQVMADSVSLTPAASAEGTYSTEVVPGWTEWAGGVSY